MRSFLRTNMEVFAVRATIAQRVLRALAEELKLPNLTFQIIRRSIATLAQRKGTVKDVQGLLRHSRAANHDRCVHAGNSRRRARSTPSTRNYEKSAGKKGWKGGLKKICYQFASKCYQAGTDDVCKCLKIWWTWSGSNRRPLPCHGSALPAAPQAHLFTEEPQGN